MYISTVAALLFVSVALADTYNFTLDTRTLPDGPNMLGSMACDAAGNCSLSPAVWIMVDNTAPVITISSPVDGTKVHGKVAINASSADASGCTQRLNVDSVVVASGNCGVISYTWQTRRVATGNHTISVTATDPVGNTSMKQITVTV